MEGGTRRLIHGLVKQTQFSVSFIALWWQNWSFRKPQSCQFSKPVFVPILICRSESQVMTEIVLPQVQAAEMDFCEEFTACYFATKCAHVKFVKTWMLSHFEKRDSSYDDRLQNQNAPEIYQGPGDEITSPFGLSPVLVWSRQSN